MSKNLKLSPPWITYVHKIESLFKGDEDVIIQYDNDDVSLKLFVSDETKAEALSKLLPMQKEFGNVVLTITVYPPDNTVKSKVDYFREAFKDNPNVAEIFHTYDPTIPIFGALTYIVFKREVVQFFNDNTQDLHGNMTTLNEDIAREIFGDTEGICFCTDNKDPNENDEIE